jgi:hypothetical protein
VCIDWIQLAQWLGVVKHDKETLGSIKDELLSSSSLGLCCMDLVLLMTFHKGAYRVDFVCIDCRGEVVPNNWKVPNSCWMFVIPPVFAIYLSHTTRRWATTVECTATPLSFIQLGFLHNCPITRSSAHEVAGNTSFVILTLSYKRNNGLVWEKLEKTAQSV